MENAIEILVSALVLLLASPLAQKIKEKIQLKEGGALFMVFGVSALLALLQNLAANGFDFQALLAQLMGDPEVFISWITGIFTAATFYYRFFLKKATGEEAKASG